jgi:hypothetical protein
MKFISHRGNLYGKKVELENNPTYIQQALDLGFDVEIDVWYVDGNFFLGHDKPTYSVSQSWFDYKKLWCHAKNADALNKMLVEDIHCFWHQTDKYTITSKGIPWCYPNNWIENGITVVDKLDLNKIFVPSDINILGICVDNPIEWEQI